MPDRSLIPLTDVQRQLRFAQAQPSNFAGGLVFYAFYLLDLEQRSVIDVFSFDVPPKSIRMNETAAAEAVALQEGGYYTDERGRYFPTLNISGTFGLRPTPINQENAGQRPSDNQRGQFTRTKTGALGIPTPPNNEKTGFDRYAHLTNLFREYWSRKKHRDLSNVAIVWANWKYGEVWVAQPLTLERSRSSPNDRFKEQYTVSLRLLEPLQANNQAIDYLVKANSAKGQQEALGTIRQEVGLAESLLSTLRELSNVANQAISVGVSQVEQVQRTLQTAIEQAKQGISQVKGLLKEASPSVSVIFSSIQEAAQNALGLATTFDEAATSVALSNPFRQAARAYKQVLRTLSRLASSLLSYASTSIVNDAAERYGNAYKQKDAFDTTDPQGVPLGVSERADNGTQTSLGARRIPAGQRIVEVPANASIKDLALLYLGSAGRWKEIVLLNRLKAPYVSTTGDGVSVLRVGDAMRLPAIPTNDPQEVNQVITFLGDDPQSDAFKYGRDLMVEDGRHSLVVDARGDLATVEGLQNLSQAMKLKVWHRKGSLRLHPWYGLDLQVGERLSLDQLSTSYLSMQTTFLSDTRVAAILQLSVISEGGVARLKILLQPKAKEDTLALTF